MAAAGGSSDRDALALPSLSDFGFRSNVLAENSCRAVVGKDPVAAVDARLRVHMANTNAATLKIAEKTADRLSPTGNSHQNDRKIHSQRRCNDGSLVMRLSSLRAVRIGKIGRQTGFDLHCLAELAVPLASVCRP
jgi:hypothetical protein